MSDVVTALEEWLEGDEGVVKFGLKLKQEWVDVAALGFIAGYGAASKREWVDLTDEEIHDIVYAQMGDQHPAVGFRVAHCIEAKLKEKNHDSV